MYKQDLTLNNLQGLICYKTQPTNQPFSSFRFLLHMVKQKDNI